VDLTRWEEPRDELRPGEWKASGPEGFESWIDVQNFQAVKKLICLIFLLYASPFKIPPNLLSS
jgi:hypothetical protein